MQCYTELLPPTGVTHCLSLSFLSANSKNLVVAKTSLLQIFAFNSRSKLVLIAEQHLPGTITALGRVKPLTSKSGGEALLVAVKDAKLSLIEWNSERHGITTVSIHYYEGEDLQTNPFAAELSQCRSILTVDPSSRCAALKFGARSLAILPFHQPGDDLVMDDYDPDADGERPELPSRATNGESMGVETPYASSFVLPLSALDPTIINPIHLAFLHEYREPTFGILYSQISPATSLLHEQKDILSYSVFTLDLEQRESTTLLSVSRLPNDLYKIIPLPLPVGGALLVGGNELIHVDQGGKTNSVGVNEFARQASSFSMADQSDLAMKLEWCTIEQFGTDSADMLIGLNTGQLAILNFRLDGRSVSGLSVRRVAHENGGTLLQAGTSSSAVLGSGTVFFGSEEADSVLVTWNSRTGQLKRQRSYGGQTTLEKAEPSEEEDDDMDDYEDDLYSGVADGVARSQSAVTSPASVVADYAFRVADRLPNLGPLGDIAVGRPLSHSGVKQKTGEGVTANLELVAPSGAGEAGGVAILKREIDPLISSESVLPKAEGLWTVSAKSKKEANVANATNGARTDYDQFLVVSKSSESGDGQSMAYRLTETGLDELKGTEFEPDAGLTVDVGTLADGTRVVQALRSEVRSYDSDFGLAQIYPMADEDTGTEPKITMTSFCDPYLLLVRDDGSLLVLEADESGDLDAVEQGEAITSAKWQSGCLYQDQAGIFVSPESQATSSDRDNTLMFVLNGRGALQLFVLPDLSRPAYTLESVGFFPPMLSPEYTARRYASPESVTEILVADLGDSEACAPFLILRTMNNDLALYEPFHCTPTASEQSSFQSLRFLKVPNYHLPKTPPDITEELEDTGLESSKESSKKPLRVLSNVSGLSAVFLPGHSPSFILKSSSSHPRVVNLRGEAVFGLTRCNTSLCQNGFAYVDSEGVLRTAQLPSELHIWESSWVSQKIKLGENIDCLCNHSSTGLYILGTGHKSGFKLPVDDELHYEWKNEEISFLPQVEQGAIEILTPQNWSIIDRYQLDPAERVLCMKSLTLEIEDSQEWKELVAVGTGFVRGEDISARGRTYIFDIIDVVPEPGRPETGRRLKLLSKEEVKGVVTAISSIGTEGCLLIAQGQKCMVRGLKEDGNLLPVAFMDMQCYVSVAKELKGTGMCLMGDALKGLWLVGYTEEPYRMTLFGKDNLGLPVIAADFLPDGKQLYIISADDECNLHVLQFDPENPKSLSGQRLLHRSTFHAGHFPTSITLLPRTAVGAELATSTGDKMDTEVPVANHQILVTYQSGAVGLLTPLSESSYRRLSALQMQLWNALDHTCGLNPRAYRAAESDGIGGRTVVDGTLLRRWLELGNQRRKDVAGRAGAESWEIRADLEIVGGAGLGYL